ncbi:titin isoform X6 [Ceratitis capitata]|uniref:titin isoform X6 n=1 Tax=Ceratitis capitata TaxID=7213 RepID=UPI0003299DFC|nr:titin isoform X6 [Ceratitis capitata]
MVIDIKMCRFENVPWGFRLVGGADFEFPLTVVKVNEGSIAEEAGLREDDVIVRINDTATSPLSHDEADKVIRSCGNVFYIGVQRESEEEPVPKMFPVLSAERSLTPPAISDMTGRKSPIPRQLAVESPPPPETELLPDLPERPCSVLSEQSEIKLVEEEIAAVLSGESEVLKDHNVLGIFPKPGVCMTSDVLRTLNENAIKTKAEKDKENKKWSTFLIKPDRPIPKSKEQIEAERRAANAYKVQIVKSAPRSRSVSPMPNPPEPVTPAEPLIEEKQPTPPKVEEVEEPPPTDSELPNLVEVKIAVEPPVEENENLQLEAASEQNTEEQESEEVGSKCEQQSPPAEAVSSVEEIEEKDIVANGDETTNNVATSAASDNSSLIQREKTEEELALERQLADVQRQLAALSSLPSTIQSTLDAVTKQLASLLPAFQLQTTAQTQPSQSQVTSVAAAEPRSISLEKIDESAEVAKIEKEEEQASKSASSLENSVVAEKDSESLEAVKENIETDTPVLSAVKQQEAKQNKEDRQQMEEEQDVKKQKRSEVIEELEEQLERKSNPRRSKRAFGPLTPSSERPLVLPGGRRWYKPKDAYNDEFIAETLSAQAELITGTTLGVNFMKYQKPEKKIDLNRSEVYKVIHHLDRQPVRGIEVRPPVVPAEVDIRKVALQP